MANASILHKDYPWVSPQQPVIVSAPMMKISLAHYALATSQVGGIGFLAGGFDLNPLKNDLAEAESLIKSGQYSNLNLNKGLLPIGVGVQNWGADLDVFIDVLRTNAVAAVWFFAPRKISDLQRWTDAVRGLNSEIKVWIQIGTVDEAREVIPMKPDVLVVQGADAGGHGRAQRAGIVTLLPEVYDMISSEGSGIPLIAAGGIIDGRGVAAALTLGAEGVCMGTRLLASHEAKVSQGYQREVLRATDGGVTTVNSTVYDRARGIKGWPENYAGRGVINQSYLDSQAGLTDEENEKLYIEEIKKGDEGWGPNGRMTTYAGTGVGLVKEVMSIEQIVKTSQQEAITILQRTNRQYHL
jgi:nitronate monooxygenase